MPFDLPNEFPLTRSVSTTTDIFSNCSNGGFTTTNSNSHKSLRTYTPQLNKRMSNRRQECELQNRTYKSISRDGSHDSLNGNGMNQYKGILTNREKSKDELFMEFCKKAGQRPKPKDIYFIDHSPYDDAAQKDVFVVENYATIRKNRRNSNLIAATQKSNNIFNSNQSLKDSCATSNNKKVYQLKNLFDFGGSSEGTFLNNSRDNYFLQSRNNSHDSNVYSSRTLPRDFLKRNFDFDSDEYSNRRISANGLYTPYNVSMTLPSTETRTNLTPKHISNDTTDYYKKSYDTLALRNSRQRDANTGSEDALSIHWPIAIPGSPRFNYTPTSAYSPNTQRKPTQMSTFYSQHFPRTFKQSVAANNKNNAFSDEHILRYDDVEYENTNNFNRNVENVNGSTSGGSDDFGTFDLDRMEQERRKSHASLFDIEIDFENGTPV